MFEMVSIYAVFPFIAVATKPEIVTTHPVISWAYYGLGFTQPEWFVGAVGLSIIAIILLGNMVASYTVVMVTQFCFSCAHEISVALFSRQLEQEYELYSTESTSEMLKNTLDEVNRFATGFMIPVMYGMVKLITTIFILMMLMIVSFKIAITLGVVYSLTYGLFYSKVKMKLSSWGHLRSKYVAERLKIVQESLRGFKEIQVSTKTDHFIDNFDRVSSDFNMTEVKNVVTPSLARYVLEATSIAGMVGVGIYLVFAGGNLVEAMPLLAMYALSGLRLMPAVQQLFSSVTWARFHHAALIILEKEFLSHEKQRAKQKSSNDPVLKKILMRNQASTIELIDVTYRYPNTTKDVLENISLSIPANTTVGIMGKTGSGKSTLIDLLMGFLPVTSGTIKIDGQSVSDADIKQLRSYMGYVPQRLFLLDASISENIAFGIDKKKINQEQVEACAKAADIHEYILTLEKGYETIVGENGIRLSGGQQQRIAIARALYNKPKMIVLDEATSALDSETEEKIIETLASLNGKVTIVMIAHRLSTLEYCDQVVLLSNGQLRAKGTLDAVLNSPAYANIRHLEGIPTDVAPS